jgi:hypothetical protein
MLEDIPENGAAKGRNEVALPAEVADRRKMERLSLEDSVYIERSRHRIAAHL